MDTLYSYTDTQLKMSGMGRHNDTHRHIFMLMYQKLTEPPSDGNHSYSSLFPSQNLLRVYPLLVPQVAPPNPGTTQWRLLLLQGSQYPVDEAIGQKDPD